MRLLIIKDFRLLSSGFLLCNATHVVCRCHLALFMLLCEYWGLGNWRKNNNALLLV